MKISKEDRDNLIACSLGDGYLYKKGQLEIYHSLKQRDLVEYKYSLLKKYVSYKNLHTKERKNGKPLYGFRTKSNKFTRCLRKIIYKGTSKKHVTEKILNRLSLKHLGLLWMDDGSRYVHKDKETGKIKSITYEFSTCCSEKDADIYISWIYNLTGVTFRKVLRKGKYYSLRLSTKEGKVFSKKLYPYVLESFHYKIDT